MDFDDLAQALYVEEFADVFGMEGAIFGETKLNIELKELIQSLQSHKDKLQRAKGACLCLSEDFSSDLGVDTVRQIESLINIDNIYTFFIKKNPFFKTKEGLYSYTLILSGL